jgi:hypothetical protein
MRAVLIGVLATCAAMAQTTTVAETHVAGPSGGLATGTITIKATAAFVAADGTRVETAAIVVSVTNGAFSVALEPNDTGTPAGTGYRAVWQLNNARPRTDIWIVRTSVASLHVSDVIAALGPNLTCAQITGGCGNGSSNGSAGADGNTVLYGTAAPTTEGVNGNFYIRTSTNFLYGPKAGGVWPSGTSLVGSQGSQGIQGVQGATGSAGAAGAQGPAGSNGSNGSAGADGNTVLYGTAAPTTEGVNGNFYIRTSTNFLYGPKAGGVWPSGTSLVGPQGSQGIQGVQGATGSAGAAGAQGPAPSGTGLVKSTAGVAGLAVAGVDYQAAGTVDILRFGICITAGCGSETTINYIAAMVSGQFSVCAFNLSSGPTGSSVIVDVQDGAGTSIFGSTKLVIPVASTDVVMQTTFAHSPQTFSATDKFKAVVLQNDSEFAAQGGTVQCR